mgnify:CR=1 FL=1|tara:strand:+ start:725 stop:1198 length:474 start_codon:yes stop_codon:yes gene_type:complete
MFTEKTVNNYEEALKNASMRNIGHNTCLLYQDANGVYHSMNKDIEDMKRMTQKIVRKKFLKEAKIKAREERERKRERKRERYLEEAKIRRRIALVEQEKEEKRITVTGYMGGNDFDTARKKLYNQQVTKEMEERKILIKSLQYEIKITAPKKKKRSN